MMVRRKISAPPGNEILGAHVVAETILPKDGSGGHVDRMAKYNIIIKKSVKKVNLQDQDLLGTAML